MFQRALVHYASRGVNSHAIRSKSMISFPTSMIKPSSQFTMRFAQQRTFSTINQFKSLQTTQYRTPLLTNTKKTRQFSTNAPQQPVAASEAAATTTSATAEATTTATEAAAATTEGAAYAKIKPAVDPALLEAKKAQIRKRMWYFRIFTLIWLPTYVVMSKKFYNEQLYRFENPPAFEKYTKEKNLTHLYVDADEKKWSEPSQATYHGKDDLQDKKSVQRLLLRNIMIGQRVSTLLLQARAEVMSLRTKDMSTAAYKERFGDQDIFGVLLGLILDVQNKVTMNGVTTLIAFNHNMEDDEGILAKLNPFKIVGSKAIDLALKDAYLYPIVGKLALRRINAFLTWYNSMMDDEWFAKHGDEVKTVADFEKLFAYWESEQGYKRHHYERYTNGAINVPQNITTDHIKDFFDQVLTESKNVGQPLKLNSLTMTPLEEKVLSLPEKDAVIDMSKFPSKSQWSKVDLNKAKVQDEELPRNAWYYTPLPALPTV